MEYLLLSVCQLVAAVRLTALATAAKVVVVMVEGDKALEEKEEARLAVGTSNRTGTRYPKQTKNIVPSSAGIDLHFHTTHLDLHTPNLQVK